MKIILIHHKNATDILAFSGTSYFLREAIKQEFEDVVEYSNIEAVNLYSRIPREGLETVLRPSSEDLSAFLNGEKVRADFVICIGGTSSIPLYTSSIPLVYWHDSTWHTFLKAYTSEKKFDLFKRQHRDLYCWDIMALEKAALVIFSSDYIADACERNYKTKKDKLKVIPFGANLFRPPSAEFLAEAIRARKQAPVINLTFLGKDWKRKGLQKALLLVRMLNTINMPAQLHIIGCYPDIGEFLDCPYVHLYGEIDKREQSQVTLLESIFKITHFLVHPALSEPFGIALCEANAYGIPVLGTRVEGLPTIVVNGKNGYLFNPHRFVEEAAETIKTITSDFESHYYPLYHASLEEYRRRLNWKSGVRLLKETLQQLKLPGNKLGKYTDEEAGPDLERRMG
jgi:glycosyltransferase involved in cell wall biosynthesis